MLTSNRGLQENITEVLPLAGAYVLDVLQSALLAGDFIFLDFNLAQKKTEKTKNRNESIIRQWFSTGHAFAPHLLLPEVI